MKQKHLQLIGEYFNQSPEHVLYLPGGSSAEAWRVVFKDKQSCIVKCTKADHLAVESKMLTYLSKQSLLNVPDVYFLKDDVLVMSDLGLNHGLTGLGDEHAADVIAALHANQKPQYGLEFDTFIGLLPQPNNWENDWFTFFSIHRLLFMSKLAYEQGRINIQICMLIDKLIAKLDQWLLQDRGPCLLHGDLWTGNMIGNGSSLKGLIDPAIYYGEPEIELAYAQLFCSFSNRFIDRYREHYPIEPGFNEVRKPIYQLYPLLVHANIYGGMYPNQIKDILFRFV